MQCNFKLRWQEKCWKSTEVYPFFSLFKKRVWLPLAGKIVICHTLFNKHLSVPRSKSQTAGETQQSSHEEDLPIAESESSAAIEDGCTVHSVTRSGSDRSNSSGEGCTVPLSGQKLDFHEVISFGLDDIGDFKRDLTTVFNDYHRNIVSYLDFLWTRA